MLPDSEYLMGQCDLEGADSWTVAAECAALGDTKMLDDLRAGMKPAKGLCYGYFEPGDYARRPAPEILGCLKQLKLPEWLYPGAKATCHGSSYGSGIPTMIQTILKFSMADLPLDLGTAKPIVLTTEQAKRLQDAFFARYPGVKEWHKKEARNLLTNGFITTSAGHIRRFYGRKAVWKKGIKLADHDTLKEALSSKPQFYTTWATKKALWRLWYDPENRRPDGTLIVEPLICVHDSLLAQWKREDDAFARPKMRLWFQNEVEIAGQKIIIPADGTVGTDWSMKGAEKL